MAISIILVSSDSSKESVKTSTERVILFGTIPITIPDTTLSMIPLSTHVDTTLIPIVSSTIPPSLNYTPASPNYSPASDTESDLYEDSSPDHIPPLPATSPFLSSTNDSLDNDIPNTPPSPTHGQPIPHGRPYRYHLNGPVHMMTARKRVGPPSHDSSFASPSRKRSRYAVTSIPLSSPIPEAFFYARADHLPSPKRIRSSDIATDLEVSLEDRFKPYVPKGTDLKMDVDVVRCDGIEIDPRIQADIDECIAYANALRDRGIDARVVVKVVDRDEVGKDVRGPVEVRVDRFTHPVIADDIPDPAHEEGAVEVTFKTLGDLVQRFHDHTVDIPVHLVQDIEGIQRDQGHNIVVTGQQSTYILKRIEELERDNMRLRDMMYVASQRVTRSQHRELCVQRELRQIRRFRFYDGMRIARFEACARRRLDYRS
nr:hypothetical protein [Tanacetum cinerariifolium]